MRSDRRTSRRLCAVALPLLLLVPSACDTDPPPVPSDAGRRDAGPRDSGVGMDAGSDAGSDGGLDAGPDAGRDGGPDAGPDGGPDGSGPFFPDGALPPLDGDPRDGGFMPPPPDSGPCTDPDGGRLLCSCPLRVECSSDTTCGTNQVCTVDPDCGVMRCDLSGLPCGVDADCPATSVCTRGGAFDVCVPSGSTCTDLRDCPSGYSCDSGTCVARRVACADSDQCPVGYTCDTVRAPGSPFCTPIGRRCASTDGCLAPFLCRDLDGDTVNECGGDGACSCSGGERCGTDSRDSIVCSLFGPCTDDAQCAASHECLDLGLGIKNCVARGGSCASQADCPTGAVCAVPTAADSPRCIDAPRL